MGAFAGNATVTVEEVRVPFNLFSEGGDVVISTYEIEGLASVNVALV
jgi:hypothetical protein